MIKLFTLSPEKQALIRANRLAQRFSLQVVSETPDWAGASQTLMQVEAEPELVKKLFLREKISLDKVIADKSHRANECFFRLWRLGVLAPDKGPYARIWQSLADKLDFWRTALEYLLNYHIFIRHEGPECWGLLPEEDCREIFFTTLQQQKDKRICKFVSDELAQMTQAPFGPLKVRSQQLLQWQKETSLVLLVCLDRAGLNNYRKGKRMFFGKDPKPNPVSTSASAK